MNVRKKIILSIIVSFILLFITPGLVIVAAGNMPKDTSIANVPVEGLTEEEAKARLQEEIATWYGGEDLIAESDHESIMIPRQVFEFDIDGSLQELEERTKRHWSTFFMKKKNVHLPLIVNIREEVDLPEYVDSEKLLINASQVASNLGDEQIAIEYLEGATLETEAIASVEFPVPDISEATIQHIVNQLDGVTIPAESTFSFLESITLLNSLDSAELETSFVASAIYASALQTNLEIIERHSQGVIPSYTKAGMEAEVNVEENKDLLIYNPNSFAITMYAEVHDGQFIFDLESIPFEGTSELSIENRVKVDSKTITRYSSDLAPGEKQWLQSGEDGVQLEVYRSLTDENGEVEKQLVARDYYPPTPRIVVVSTQEEPVPEENELTEWTEQFTPERFISDYVLSEGSNDETDSNSNQSTNEPDSTDSAEFIDIEEDDNIKFSSTEFFYSCILESIRDGMEASEEDNEETAEENMEQEDTFSYCELFVLSLLGELIDGETLTREELEELVKLNGEDEIDKK